MRPKIPKPKFVRNAFVVVDTECIFPELDTKDIEWGDPNDFNRVYMPKQRKPDRILPSELPTFFVWAYDPDWEPPTGGATGQPGEGQLSDEDGYQGRLKVDIEVLFTFFYYAMLHGYDMKQMWRRAQTLKDQTWTTRPDYIYRSFPKQVV